MLKKFGLDSKRVINDCTFIMLGCAVLALGINVFLAPNKISAGGISSIGTVLSHLFGIRMSLTNLFFNGVLFVFGYKSLGRYAVVQTLFGIVMLSVFLEITSIIPIYTENDIISVLCGGVLMGAGVGLVVRRGASTGGSDFAGLMLKKVFPHISLARLIMIIDCTIVVISGIVFKSFTVTVYSIMALFISSIVTDKIMTVGDEAKVIQVFSSELQKISDYILEQYERGVTGIHCTGMYSKQDSMMLMCVVTPKELPIYLKLIKEIDKDAFIIIGDVHEVIGEGFKSINKL